MLAPSIRQAGLDPERLEESVGEAKARERFGAGADGPRRWTDIRSAGHSVSAVRGTYSTEELVHETRVEFEAALREVANGRFRADSGSEATM
jgi:nitronate monooxygenase